MTEKVDQRISNMNEQVALPRKNGELIFEAPWEARAFGLAITLNEQGAYPWSDFSLGLSREIASDEAVGNGSGYYERWLATLEKLVIDRGLVTREELDLMTIEQAHHDDHEHEHDHHDVCAHGHHHHN